MYVCMYVSMYSYFQVREEERQNLEWNGVLVFPLTHFLPQVSEVINLLSRKNRCRISNSVDELGDQQHCEGLLHQEESQIEKSEEGLDVHYHEQRLVLLQELKNLRPNITLYSMKKVAAMWEQVTTLSIKKVLF